jgi:hypothetical protein
VLQAQKANALHQELTSRGGRRVSQCAEGSIGWSEGEGATHAEAEVASLLLVWRGGWRGGRGGGGWGNEGKKLLQEWKKRKTGMCLRPVSCGGIFNKKVEDAVLQLVSERGGGERRAAKEM